MATILTADEVAFLAAYGLTPADVFDARPFKVADARARAKAAGQDVMLGSPCGKEGHRLRTRYNHCWQCDPKKLNFQQRHSVEGYVYLLGSKKARLFKVGCTGDLWQRIEHINYQAYGGASDWHRIWSMRLDDIGRVENDIHARLARCEVEGSYVKDGAVQATRELFRVPLARAMGAVKAVVGDDFMKGTMTTEHEDYLWE